MYVEYSGTAWTGFLKQPTEVGIDADWVYEQTAKGMKEQFGLDYLPTLGFSNAYVFAVPRAFAEEHGLEKISDLIPLAGRLTLGGTLAFMGDRPDGIRGAEAVYGFKFRRNRAMDHALLFQALQLRQVDVIVPFSTDGQVAALDLVVLEDDRGVFPPYHAGILVREDVLEENPGLREILEKLSGRIDERTMAELNYEVDGKRRERARGGLGVPQGAGSDRLIRPAVPAESNRPFAVPHGVRGPGDFRGSRTPFLCPPPPLDSAEKNDP